MDDLRTSQGLFSPNAVNNAVKKVRAEESQMIKNPFHLNWN